MIDLHYDEIATSYNNLVDQDVHNHSFPYSGYKLIQDLLTDDLSSKKKKVKILDIGCGTAKLYEHILPSKIQLVGIEQSIKMLEIAKKSYPNAKFIHHDILHGMPEILKKNTFDYIVINYVCMHFSFKTTIDLLHLLLKYLSDCGKIVIGDLLFMNPPIKQEFFYNHQDYADLDLHFHMYSQYVNKMSDQLALSFFEINDYTGMMIIENINEFTLHFEDPLVKYKSNTTKWKSTHPQRNRE